MRHFLVAGVLIAICGGCIPAEMFGPVDGSGQGRRGEPGAPRTFAGDVATGVEGSIKTGSPVPLVEYGVGALTTLLTGGYIVRQRQRGKRREKQLTAVVDGVAKAPVTDASKALVGRAIGAISEGLGVEDGADGLKAFVTKRKANVVHKQKEQGA